MGLCVVEIRDEEAAFRIPSILEQNGYRVVAEREDAGVRSFTLHGQSPLWDGRRPPGSRRARMRSLTLTIFLMPPPSKRIGPGPRLHIGVGRRSGEVLKVLKDAGVFREETAAG